MFLHCVKWVNKWLYNNKLLAIRYFKPVLGTLLKFDEIYYYFGDIRPKTDNRGRFHRILVALRL